MAAKKSAGLRAIALSTFLVVTLRPSYCQRSGESASRSLETATESFMVVVGLASNIYGEAHVRFLLRYRSILIVFRGAF